VRSTQPLTPLRTSPEDLSPSCLAKRVTCTSESHSLHLKPTLSEKGSLSTSQPSTRPPAPSRPCSPSSLLILGHQTPLVLQRRWVSPPIISLCFAAQGNLLEAGYDPSRFSGHSFRRGAASSAAQAAFTEYKIQQLGRWRSDTYKLYIDASRPRLLNSARLHWAVPTAPPFEPPSLHVALPLA
jgi:hypothetical protein